VARPSVFLLGNMACSEVSKKKKSRDYMDQLDSARASVRFIQRKGQGCYESLM
jgi:hypothetical protein